MLPVVDLYMKFLRYYFALLFALISKFRLFIRSSHCLFSFFNYCSSMFIYCSRYILFLRPSWDPLSICNTPSAQRVASLPRMKHSYFTGPKGKYIIKSQIRVRNLCSKGFLSEGREYSSSSLPERGLNEINKEIAILENNLDLSNIYSNEFQQLTNGSELACTTFTSVENLNESNRAPLTS